MHSYGGMILACAVDIFVLMGLCVFSGTGDEKDPPWYYFPADIMLIGCGWAGTAWLNFASLTHVIVGGVIFAVGFLWVVVGSVAWRR